MKRNQEQNNGSTRTEGQSIAKMLLGKNNTTPQALEVEDKTELERKEAYIEPKTRYILRNLLALGDKKEITPIYSSGLGFIYQIADALNKDETNVVSVDLLLNLARLDILNKSFYDSVSACPNCESIILTLHNRCPKCKSHNVDKTSLTEHIPCGHIDQRDKYIQDRCPKCGELLVEGQYQNMGRWYVCNECGERFEHPELDVVCRTCNRNFAVKEAQVAEISKFKLNPSRVREIRQNVASLEDIRAILTELGFSIQIPGLTIGEKSGMQHHFSLIAKKQVNEQEIVIALDHAVSESEVQPSPLILYIYKTSEVKVDIPIFIAIPKLTETARKIAQGHNILLIEGSIDQQETIEHIKQEIENRISQKATPDTTQNQKGSFFNKLRGKKN